MGETGRKVTRSDSIIRREAKYLLRTYERPDIVFTKGDGAYLFDEDGRRYLDFGAGIAVNALGHGDAEWVEAVSDQARELTHLSNLYHSRPHVDLAERLVNNSFADRVFFSNSGAEANEAALKFARRWARSKHGEGKVEIVAFQGGFHGRSIGSLSVTAREKYRTPFEPLMPGVTFTPFNDLSAAALAIDERTCAVIVEPIQGEGGVVLADGDFLQGLRRCCDENDALLIFDEVQCGLGRTGRLWAHENFGVTPDIMTLAKPLAGGLPIGATLMTERVARSIHLGDHGSTFAAGPLVCRAAQVVFDRIREPEFLAVVRTKGERLREALQALPSKHVRQVRGMGLMWGVEFDCPVRPLVSAALDAGLIVLNAGENTLRLVPPLIITESQIDEGLGTLRDCLPFLETEPYG